MWTFADFCRYENRKPTFVSFLNYLYRKLDAMDNPTYGYSPQERQRFLANALREGVCFTFVCQK